MGLLHFPRGPSKTTSGNPDFGISAAQARFECCTGHPPQNDLSHFAWPRDSTRICFSLTPTPHASCLSLTPLLLHGKERRRKVALQNWSRFHLGISDMDSGGAVALEALVFHQIGYVRVYRAAPRLVLWRAREAHPADFCTMLELFEILPEKVFLPRPPETI